MKTNLPKSAKMIIQKTLAVFIAGVFLFTSTIGWAQEERLFSTGMEKNAFSSSLADKDDLAPATRMTKAEFRDAYQLGYTLLAHEAVNKVIGDYIYSHFKVSEDTKADISGLPQYRTELVNGIEVPIVGIPDLLKKTGQFGHVGLGKWNDRPVVYVDTKCFYTENEALQHDREEAAAYVALKTELEAKKGVPIEYNRLRQAILETTKAKDTRDKIHRQSADLSEIIASVKISEIDLDAVYELYLKYGFDKDKKDFNIAAHSAAPQDEKGTEIIDKAAGPGNGRPYSDAEYMADIEKIMARCMSDRAKASMARFQISPHFVFMKEAEPVFKKYFPNLEFDINDFKTKEIWEEAFGRLFSDEATARRILLRLRQIYVKYNTLAGIVNERLRERLGRHDARIDKLVFVFEGRRNPMRNIMPIKTGAMRLALNIDFLLDERNDIFEIACVAHEAGHGLTPYIENSQSAGLEEDEEMLANWAAAAILEPQEAAGLVTQQIETHDIVGMPLEGHKLAELTAIAKELHLSADLTARLEPGHPLTEAYSRYFKKLKWAGPAQPRSTSDTDGPALFVDPKTGEARELKDDEHKALNEALLRVIGDFNAPGICATKLTEAETQKLCGQARMGTDPVRDPSISVYIIDDTLPKFKYELAKSGYADLADGLITHAGTFKGKAYNLFIPRSIYEMFISGLIDEATLSLWREHELGHLRNRQADIAPTAEEAQAAAAIYRARTAIDKDIAQFVVVLNSQEGQQRLGDLIQRYILDAFSKEYALEVFPSGVGELIEGNETGVGLLAQGIHTHPTYYIPENYAFDEALSDQALSQLRIRPTIGVGPVPSDIKGCVGMVITGTEEGGFWGLVFDGEMMLKAGLSASKGFDALEFWYNKGAFKIYRLIDSTKNVPVGNSFVAGAKRFSLQESTPGELEQSERGLRYNLDAIRANIKSRYSNMIKRRQQERIAALGRKAELLAAQRRFENSLPPHERIKLLSARLNAVKNGHQIFEEMPLISNLPFVDYLEAAIKAEKFDDALNLIDDTKYFLASSDAAELLARMLFDDEITVRKKTEDFLIGNMSRFRVLKEKLGNSFPEIGYTPGRKVGEINQVTPQAAKLTTAPSKQPKGSPADCLETIKASEMLFRRALDSSGGVTSKEVAAERPFSRRTVDKEFEMLKDVGILVPIEGKSGYYRFADMLIGLDANYTKTLINVVNDLRYQIGEGGDERPLHRGSLATKAKTPDRETKDNAGAVKELVRMVVLHQINIMQEPALPQGKVLWHILERDLLAESQKNSFAQQLNNLSKKSSAPERIYVLRQGETIEKAIAAIKVACPEAIFDIGLSSVDHIDQVPVLEGGEKIEMLVFEGEASYFRQLEGVIAALRALHLKEGERIPTLKHIYEIMNKTACDWDIPPAPITDPREFARKFIFRLPPITTVPIDDMPKINEKLLMLLTAA